MELFQWGVSYGVVFHGQCFMVLFPWGDGESFMVLFPWVVLDGGMERVYGVV